MNFSYPWTRYMLPLICIFFNYFLQCLIIFWVQVFTSLVWFIPKYFILFEAILNGIVFFLLLFKYSCLHFHPIMAPGPTHPHLPTLNLPPLALSMCPSYMFLDGPSPIIPNYPSPPSSLLTVSLFIISMSLVVFCLLVLLIVFLTYFMTVNFWNIKVQLIFGY